ncbi:Fur-regulated basic protein FbpA [Mesobacillus foraminis]|uniref:Fur-regulated basic protein FbpA n=1 Tax=Mesobacillus foraminis TaxID=279826 RepID=UPI0039A01867
MGQLSQAVARRKEKLIQKLLALGVYKKDKHHLYELTLSEIELEYQNERNRMKTMR